MTDDPRPLFDRAHDWCLGLVRDLTPADLDAATPCTAWDVRTVVAHQIAAVRRAAVVGQGGAPMDVPLVLEGIADDELADRYAEELAVCRAVWADDAMLDRSFPAPWGEVPGRGAVGGWAKEPMVHGWDIAVATGRPAEGPADVAEALLVTAAQFLPAEGREHSPFDPPAPVADDAGPTERLAAWLGHVRR